MKNNKNNENMFASKKGVGFNVPRTADDASWFRSKHLSSATTLCFWQDEGGCLATMSVMATVFLVFRFFHKHITAKTATTRARAVYVPSDTCDPQMLL